jgi:hypothetical protein
MGLRKSATQNTTTMAEFTEATDITIQEEGEEVITVDPSHEKAPEAEVIISLPAPVGFPRNLPQTMIDAANAVNVLYCGICSMPPEFCEFGRTVEQCREWLRENCPELSVIEGGIGKLSVSEGGEAEVS